MAKFTVRLKARVSEMAGEEILKQAAFLSGEIRGLRICDDAQTIEFSAPDERGPALAEEVMALATSTQRALRSLQRKIVFRSPAMDITHFREETAAVTGVRFLGAGQVALEGMPLRIFRYFDRVFAEAGAAWNATPLIAPTLIPGKILARCDYFRSFPQYVTFAAHLKPDASVIDGFRNRHQSAKEVDAIALADMDAPEACLSPAVCYHVYHLYENCTIPAAATVYGLCGKCFRYESTNLSDLRRLWDFTMREIVFMGGRDEVLSARDQSIELMARILLDHEIAAEIRTASDPFFVAPDAASKTYFQLSSDSKFEVSALLPGGERLAIGSHNYHSDFFGRAFDIGVEGGGPMHSVCVAFGLERWVHAFIQQHGTDPDRWPERVRNAPEMR